jgi:EmrB/QacA subfamily drug resistance transporter
MTITTTSSPRSQTVAAAPPSLSNLPRRQIVGTLIGIALALFLSALDQTIVGTALPRIVAELQGFDHYAWVTTSYLLLSTAIVPIVGKLSDLYGRKLFFVVGIGIFLIGSVLCGIARDMLQLVAFRGLQGLGAGFLTSMAFASVGDLFPPARRGRIQGVFAAVFGLSSVIGPVAGGYITDNLSWRWVFFVNLPIGLIALGAVLALYPHLRPEPRHRSIDYAGAVTLILSTGALLLALSWGGREYPWDSRQIVGLLAFGLALTVVFLVCESRAAEPIIPLSLFRNSIVSVSTTALTLMSIGMFGTILFVPLFFQGVLGTTATASGTALTPMMFAMIAGSMIAGQIMTRFGHYRLLALVGMGIMTVGMFLISTMGPTTGYASAVAYAAFMGLGLGMNFPIYTIVVQNAVPYAQLGTATALTQFARSIGGTLGAAIFGALLVNRYTAAFQAVLSPQLASALPADRLTQLANPQLLLNPLGAEALQASFVQLGPRGPELYAQALAVVRTSLSSALHDTFLLGTVISALAFFVVVFLKEVPLRRSHAPASTREATDGRVTSEGLAG